MGFVIRQLYGSSMNGKAALSPGSQRVYVARIERKVIQGVTANDLKRHGTSRHSYISSAGHRASNKPVNLPETLRLAVWLRGSTSTYCSTPSRVSTEMVNRSRAYNIAI